jgi:TPR repeat protein
MKASEILLENPQMMDLDTLFKLAVCFENSDTAKYLELVQRIGGLSSQSYRRGFNPYCEANYLLSFFYETGKYFTQNYQTAFDLYLRMAQLFQHKSILAVERFYETKLCEFSFNSFLEFLKDAFKNNSVWL